MTPGAWQTKRSGELSRGIGVLHAAFGAAALLYLACWLVGLHDATVDDWGVDAFEFVVSLFCLTGALRSPAGRRAFPLALGLGIVSWSVGDLVTSIESLSGATVPTPSLADAFYIGYYVLTYVAVVAFVRREMRSRRSLSWLDGLIAGLGAAAVCAAFAFHQTVVAAGSSPLATATDLAYPIGDLLLLGLIVGGTVLVPGGRRAPWLLLSAACVVNGVGDTANLFRNAIGQSHLGGAINAAAWPTSMVLTSAAVWLRRPAVQLTDDTEKPAFVLPTLSMLAGIAVLVAAADRRLSLAAVGLSAATLVTSGLRLVVSIRTLQRLTDQRHRESVTDHLTGIGNRRRLGSHMEAYFAGGVSSDPAQSLAFLFVDLDRFKDVNDNFGHQAGDQLLRQIRPRLQAITRSDDLAVRLGGDEFAVLLPGVDQAEAAAAAHRLLAELEKPFRLDGVDANISASIGVALAPDHALDSANLIRGADIAMYRAKMTGTGVEVFDPELDHECSLLQLTADLARATAVGAFTVHYQPQQDLTTGEITGLEALLRWPHPRLGMVPPLKFLPMAEQAGLMPAITEWVLDQALGQCAIWRADGRTITVSVNVTVTDLLLPDFPAVVAAALDRHDLPGAALVLEITETSVISNYQLCKQTIDELCRLGLTVSIDDFGAGFTSLAYLGDLAIGELKLDRAFVSGFTEGGSERSLELIRSTIDLGHALGLRVVGEGIEDEATLEALTRFGCDQAQGFVISRPKEPAQLELAPAPLPEPV